MSARPSLFKETDVKRAFVAAKMAGVDVARVDIGKDGKISIIPVSAVAGEGGNPQEKVPAAGAGLQSWD